MQELMVYAGHLDCYCRCEEILEKFTSVQVSPSQIYRVTEHVSESLKGEDLRIKRTLQPLTKEQITVLTLNSSGVRDIGRILGINKNTVVSEFILKRI